MQLFGVFGYYPLWGSTGVSCNYRKFPTNKLLICINSPYFRRRLTKSYIMALITAFKKLYLYLDPPRASTILFQNTKQKLPKKLTVFLTINFVTSLCFDVIVFTIMHRRRRTDFLSTDFDQNLVHMYIYNKFNILIPNFIPLAFCILELAWS